MVQPMINDTKPLIGICTKLNGWGLEYDFKVMKNILEPDYQVDYLEYQTRPKLKYDLIIFSEMVDGRMFRSANKLATLVNPEWFWWEYNPNRFNFNLAKTNYTKSVLQKLGYSNIYTTGFTTTDEYDPAVPKKLEFCHFAGNSQFKGTEAVLKAWISTPSLPTLHVFNSYPINYHKWVKDAKNVQYHYGRISNEELKRVRNSCYFSIQPSRSEGFGHCLWQPMSSKSLVITTNAPPMNEIPNVFKVKATKSGTHHKGDLFDVTPQAILETVNQVLSLSENEIRDIGEQNREIYLQNDVNFRKQFKRIINEQIQG